MTTLLRQFAARLVTSQESLVAKDGMEREYVFFGKMVDKSDLDKATGYSDQEQYRVIVPSTEKGREITVRLRKTVHWDKNEKGEFAQDPVYHLTIKSFLKGEEGCLEAENELPAEVGEKLLVVFRTAGEGLIKRRYTFKVGRGYYPDSDERVGVRMPFPKEMEWEVDAPKEFKDGKDLTRSELDDGGWVKLDLEVLKWDLKIQDNRFELPFPIRLTDVVYAQPGKRSKAQEATVKKALNALCTTP